MLTGTEDGAPFVGFSESLCVDGTLRCAASPVSRMPVPCRTTERTAERGKLCKCRRECGFYECPLGAGRAVVRSACLGQTSRGNGTPGRHASPGCRPRAYDRDAPVDSRRFGRYEAAVAAALVAAERRFEKPLRFDAGTEQVFPDFWLRDRSEIVPMEVWGLTDPDYAARKAQKIAHYDEKYGPGKWWQWDAAAGAPIPPFP